MTISTVLESGTSYDVVFPDFYLTPSEKYAKRPDGFLAKDRIALVGREDDDVIDDSIVSYPPPVLDAPSPAEEKNDTSDTSSQGASFEQISLFDDDK